MTSSDGLFYALLTVLGGLSATAGYLLGLRRFESRSRDELHETRTELATTKAAKEAIERDLSQCKAAAERDLVAAKATAERTVQDAQRASTQAIDEKAAAERALADARDAAAKRAG